MGQGIHEHIHPIGETDILYPAHRIVKGQTANPPGEDAPIREIIHNPDVFIYIDSFGSSPGDHGVVGGRGR